MVRAGVFDRARERVDRICGSRGDDRALRLDVLGEIRRGVGFDAYAWLLTDPETAVGSAPLADVPCLSELPRLIRLKYLTTLNRWTSLAPGRVGLLWSGREGPSRSLLWRELLFAYDVVDVASSVFRDRWGCWGFLDLWRSGPAAHFNDDEAAFLAGIGAPVTSALRRAAANTFVTPSSPDRPRLGPMVLLLSADLVVVGQTPDTERYLRLLVSPPGDRAPIPAGAYNVAAQLLAGEAGVDAHPPSARVHLSGGVWVTLRAARLGGADGDGDIAVTIEETSPDQRVSLFAKSSALSPRESEVLGHLVSGSDTRQLAERLFISEHTVQDHFKSIFAKTGARTRASLLSKVLGNGPSHGGANVG